VIRRLRANTNRHRKSEDWPVRVVYITAFRTLQTGAWPSLPICNATAAGTAPCSDTTQCRPKQRKWSSNIVSKLRSSKLNSKRQDTVLRRLVMATITCYETTTVGSSLQTARRISTILYPVPMNSTSISFFSFFETNDEHSLLLVFLMGTTNMYPTTCPLKSFYHHMIMM
jgi:hypothetical protein